MRRIKQDPEEIRQMEDALSRAATPTHEQITEEFNSLAYLQQLQILQDNVILQNEHLREPVEDV